MVTGATDGIGKAYAEAVSIALDLSVYKTNPLAVLTVNCIHKCNLSVY